MPVVGHRVTNRRDLGNAPDVRMPGRSVRRQNHGTEPTTDRRTRLSGRGQGITSLEEMSVLQTRDVILNFKDLEGEPESTRTRRYDGMVHGFFWMAGVIDRSRELIDELGRELHIVLSV